LFTNFLYNVFLSHVWSSDEEPSTLKMVSHQWTETVIDNCLRSFPREWTRVSHCRVPCRLSICIYE